MTHEEIINTYKERCNKLTDVNLYLAKLCDEKDDLINRQQAEIEELREKNAGLALALLHEVVNEDEQLRNEITKVAKSEAYKEFAEQLEAEIISSDKYIREYDDSEVQKAYNKGLRDALKILKEMGCDNA